MTRQRRRQILEAMASVVARDGLAGTTIVNVAAAAGLQRTLVLHYFRDRDELMTAFIAEAVAAYGERMVLGEEGDSVEDRLDRLFEPGAYRHAEDLVVWTELVALAARDTGVRHQLHELWTRRWLPSAEQQLQAAYATAPADRVAETAYAIAGLVEAQWAFHLQGLTDSTRRGQLRNAARALVAQLGERP